MAGGLKSEQDAKPDVLAAISLVIEAKKADKTANLDEAKSLLTKAKNRRSVAFDKASAANVAAQTGAADVAAAITALATAEGLLDTALADPASAKKVDAALQQLERCRSLLDSVGKSVETDPRPNMLALLHDDARTIITLSTGLLGISATFATNLLGDANALSRWALVLAWLLLALSIVWAIFASGRVTASAGGARTPTPAKDLHKAFITMVCGVALLGAAVGFTWIDDDSPDTVKEVVDQAKDDIRGVTDDDSLELVATSFKQVNDVTTIVLTDTANRSWTVTIEDGKATTVSQG